MRTNDQHLHDFIQAIRKKATALKHADTIADLPAEHWLKRGREIAAVGGEAEGAAVALYMATWVEDGRPA